MRIIMPSLPLVAIVAIFAHSASQQIAARQIATSSVSAHPWCQAYWSYILAEKHARELAALPQAKTTKTTR
jgi:hypothetical protein